jgi:hypothetical protein
MVYNIIIIKINKMMLKRLGQMNVLRNTVRNFNRPLPIMQPIMMPFSTFKVNVNPIQSDLDALKA